MPLSVKSFYSKRTVQCGFLQDAIRVVEQEDVDAADLVLTGPSNAGNVTDEEEDDEQVLSHNGLPGEVSGDIEVVTKSIDTEEKDDQENSDGGEPPRKQKNNKTMKDKTKKNPQ